ncbi:MAG: PadR family transcriptional regulator [Acidobacteria bacterium]|nr:PadR family transcriptional regulator [Acidobacteriota bacterium]
MDLLKGTLDVLILRTLSDSPSHGYAVARAIREQSAETLIVEEGALYPALRRLEKRGLLKASWGRTDTGREAKFYALTAPGKKQLKQAMSDWDRYVEAMGLVLRGPQA